MCLWNIRRFDYYFVVGLLRGVKIYAAAKKGW